MSRLSLALSAGLAFALASCGAAEPPQEGRFQRLDLRPPDGEQIVLPEPQVQRLTVPEGVEPWTLLGPDFELRTLETGERAVWFAQGGQVRVPGPFDPTRFQTVVVLATLHGECHVNVQLGGKGGERVGDFSGTGEGPPTALIFEFPELSRRAVAVEELRVSVRGAGFLLHAVELLEVPLEVSLPAPGELGLVDVGGEARRATTLRTGTPLQARLDVATGDVLRFALGRPAAGSRRAGAEHVYLSLQGLGPRGQGQSRSYELTPDAQGAVAWSEVRVPLEDFAQQSMRVRLELRPGAGAPPVVCVAEALVESPSERPPRVLLITSDTHRGDHLGLYFDEAKLTTPALDALAERGVLFEDCYATSSFTSPSHVALMTGLSPRDTGVVRNSGSYVKDTARTLAEAFHAAGFATYAVVTFQHLGPDGTGLGQGFDRMAWCETNDWDAATPVSILEGWLPDAAGRPLFAWLHVADAHFPYAPPQGYDRLYYPSDGDPFDPERPAPQLPPKALPRDLADLRDLEYPRAQYRAEISYLDRELGRLLDLPRLGEALVAFTSDHGEVMGDHGSWFAHLEIWPDTLHVPLILAGPGVEPGRRVGRPVVQTDVARTLLDLAGLEDTPFPGRNLLAPDQSTGAEAEPRFALGPYAASASIAWERWFLLLALRDKPPSEALQLGRHEVLLFDLEQDPGCTRDVAAEHPDVTVRLRAALVRWLSRPEGEALSEQVTQDAETLAQLAALGYTGETWSVEGRAWIDPECDCVACRAWRE